MWMACSAIGRSTIGRWKLMMIGLADADHGAVDRVEGRRQEHRLTRCTASGSGPPGCLRGWSSARFANGSAGGAAGGASGSTGAAGGASGSTGAGGGGTASGSAGGGGANGSTGAGGGGAIAAAGSIGASARPERVRAGGGRTGQERARDRRMPTGYRAPIPPIKPTAIVAVTSFRIMRCGMRTPPVKAWTSLAQREDGLTPKWASPTRTPVQPTALSCPVHRLRVSNVTSCWLPGQMRTGHG